MPYLHDSRAIVTRPINQAYSKETAAAWFVSLLLFFCCIWTGLALELKISLCFLIFSFSFVSSVCGDSNILE